MKRRIGRLSFLMLLVALAPVSAQESTTTPPEPNVKQLIQQLDAPKFGDRQVASQKLAEAGKDAIAALAESAATGSREASTRSIEILKKYLQSRDEATQKAARESLEKLSQSEQPRVASAATDALKPKPAGGVDPGNGALPGIQFGGGQIQLQVQAVAGNGGRRTTFQNVNGVKTTTVEENNRKIKIVDDPQNGIKMEVIDKVDGKEQTKKYEAKDADDLKKKHPDAHKLFEEHSKQPNLQIQFNAFPAIPGVPAIPGPPGLPGAPALPGRVIPVPLLPALRPAFGNPKAVQEQLEHVQKEIQEAQQRLKKVAENSPQADQLNKVVEQLDSARKQLDESLEKLKSP